MHIQRDASVEEGEEKREEVGERGRVMKSKTATRAAEDLEGSPVGD